MSSTQRPAPLNPDDALGIDMAYLVVVAFSNREFLTESFEARNPTLSLPPILNSTISDVSACLSAIVEWGLAKASDEGLMQKEGLWFWKDVIFEFLNKNLRKTNFRSYAEFEWMYRKTLNFGNKLLIEMRKIGARSGTKRGIREKQARLNAHMFGVTAQAEWERILLGPELPPTPLIESV